jgi:hypothetical protein
MVLVMAAIIFSVVLIIITYRQYQPASSSKLGCFVLFIKLGRSII